MKRFKKHELDRRTFLKCALGGAGTLVGLPVLEVMFGSVARAVGAGYTDANFVAFFKPLGIMREHFFPRQYQAGGAGVGVYTGTQWALDGYSSQALAAHKDAISIFAGAGYAVRGDDHEEEAKRFLTGLSGLAGFGNANDVRLDPGSRPEQGKSMDQYIADRLFEAANPMRPAIHSLQLCTDTNTAPGHNHISYKDKSTALTPTSDLEKVYDTLFFGFNPGASAAALSQRDTRKRNVLDDVWNSGTKSLLGTLGKSDRFTVERYLASIESVRKKIDAYAKDSGVVAGACTKPARPTNLPKSGPTYFSPNVQKHFEIMCDLLVIALQCGRARVATYLMGPSFGATAGGRSFDFLIPSIPANVPERSAVESWLRIGNHHEVSHFESHPTLSASSGLWANAIIDRFYLERFAYFVGKLKAANLLDRTLVLFGAGFGMPEYHSSQAVPCITAGRGAGARTNVLQVFQRFAKYDVDSGPNYYKAAMAKLHVDIMSAFGVPGISTDNFGLRKGEDPGDAARRAAFALFG